jgi:ABC-type nitrate/sulfonate/bicarbonate transport system permease component
MRVLVGYGVGVAVGVAVGVLVGMALLVGKVVALDNGVALSPEIAG